MLLDIGLARSVDRDDPAWTLHDAATLGALLPPVGWNAHKGARGRLLVVGGAEGMAGAVTLALGIGMQNFPEGIAVAMPLRREGVSRLKSFWYGQLSASVEPVNSTPWTRSSPTCARVAAAG